MRTRAGQGDVTTEHLFPSISGERKPIKSELAHPLIDAWAVPKVAKGVDLRRLLLLGKKKTMNAKLRLDAVPQRNNRCCESAVVDISEAVMLPKRKVGKRF